jgi:hypothetical protein
MWHKQRTLRIVREARKGGEAGGSLKGKAVAEAAR